MFRSLSWPAELRGGSGGEDFRTFSPPEPSAPLPARLHLAAARKWREEGEAIESAASRGGIAVHWAAAKAAEDMVRKGSAALVEGRLAVREYKDGEGGP